MKAMHLSRNLSRMLAHLFSNQWPAHLDDLMLPYYLAILSHCFSLGLKLGAHGQPEAKESKGIEESKLQTDVRE